MKATITAALMLLSTNQTAHAAAERYSCVEGNDTPTIFEVDRTAKAFLTTEGGEVHLDRQPVCAAFAQVGGEAVRNLQPTCTVAFGQDVVVADYVVLGEKSLNAMMALDSNTLRLTTILRLGTAMAVVKAIPCKRL